MEVVLYTCVMEESCPYACHEATASDLTTTLEQFIVFNMISSFHEPDGCSSFLSIFKRLKYLLIVLESFRKFTVVGNSVTETCSCYGSDGIFQSFVSIFISQKDLDHFI